MKLLLPFLFIITISSARAQFCDTVTDSAWSARFEELLAASDPGMRATIDTGLVDVPVIFHVQTRSSSPVISAKRIADALKATNDWFFAGGVRFIRCGEIQTYPEGASPSFNYRAVNVSLYRAATGCGYAMGNQVHINVDCSRTLENILSHELGHVVGLPHTHGYTNSGTTDELADGSNCATHGDRFCDTPADPNLLAKVNSNCVYTGSAKDANGMVYMPATRNIMSYTSSKCADTLSPMQLARARAVALASKLECCFVAPPLVRDTTVCRGDAVTLTAQGIGREIRWYDDAEGGQPAGIGAVFTTPPVLERRAWYAEVVDSCVSSRSRVVVRVALASGVRTDIVRIVAAPDSSSRPSLNKQTSNDSVLLFRTGDGALWSTDGSPSGTQRIAERPSGADVNITDAALWKGMVLYGVNDRGTGPMLFRVDPDGDHTEELLRISGREGFSNFWLTELDSIVLFILNDGMDGTELWRSDGTVAGTQRVAEFSQTSAYNDFDFLSVGGAAYFQASDSLYGSELWRSDGTTKGTRLVADMAAGVADSDPGEFTVSDGLIYFSADDGNTGRELWVTDGTMGGTRLAADIHSGPGGSNPGSITALNGVLFMYADDGVHGIEPFISDGTPEGTRLVADLRPGNGSFPQHFTMLNGRIYCVANDGSGSELWELRDGGFSGAALLKDIHPFSSSGISGLLNTGTELFFTANDAVHGNELWRSDGSAEGTRLAADIDTGGSSSPTGLTMLGGRLLFFAGSQASGPALYTIAPLDVVVCLGESAELMVGNTDGVVRWYSDQYGGPLLYEGRVWRTPPLTEAAVFWVELADGTCVSARSAVPVRLLAAAPTILGPSSVVTGSDATLEAETRGGLIEWHARDDGSALLDTGRTLLLSSLQQSVVIYARTIEGRCVSSFVSHRIDVRTSTAVAHKPTGFALRLHPNPAQKEVQISIDNPFSGALRIVDLLGRTMLHEPVAFESRYVVAVGHFRTGIYVLELRNANQRILRMFVVAR